MKQLSILGLGLMGGSLGLAARSSGTVDRVHAFARREETRAECMRMGVADAVFGDPEAAASGANIAVVCVPILSTTELVLAAASAMPPGSVVTDVGSTKAILCGQAREAVASSGVHFVGSHPIAGSDMTGVAASRRDLYEGATVVVTPDADTPEAAVLTVRQLWEALGARVALMSPEEHDTILARTSHLPHLLAAVLVQRVLEDDGRLREYCGSGFADSTRIAAGSAEVWHDIIKTNASAIAAELRAVGGMAEELAGQIDAGRLDEVKTLLEHSRQLRMARAKRDREYDE